MTRYDDMMESDPAPRRTKMLRYVGRDGNHERFEAWWLDADGYPTHPVEAGNESTNLTGD
jgi:hypothetical protein